LSIFDYCAGTISILPRWDGYEIQLPFIPSIRLDSERADSFFLLCPVGPSMALFSHFLVQMERVEKLKKFIELNKFTFFELTDEG
jgi:hypothetical protein